MNKNESSFNLGTPVKGSITHVEIIKKLVMYTAKDAIQYTLRMGACWRDVKECKDFFTSYKTKCDIEQ